MISRRNIRVKVMQLIYALETFEDPEGKNDPLKTLHKKLDESRKLFVYLLYFITEVARYAETDARLRASRNLLTKEDLNVNIKIAGNEVLWKILENPSFKLAVKEDKPELIEEGQGMIRKIYLDVVTSEVYRNYVTVEGRNKYSEKEMIQFIFTDLMLPNENFISFIEENFCNWDDDAEMMNQLILNYLQKPGNYNLQAMVGEEKWLFAKGLLTTVTEKMEFVTGLIKPKLKNWDADRIAMLDMILMQMGVCELLFFETIPPKVTINEYIDIAKEYSTQQSGHFVNGILDSIHKELLSQNKIHKKDFKHKAS